MANLPQELIIEILLCLPVKPLLRFRCISKSLCNLFDSSNFINAHIKRSTETRTHLKLILKEERNNNLPTNIYTADFNDGLHEAKMLHNTFKPMVSTIIYGSCNGLLLLCFDDKTFALWNPFTRRCKRLPVCPGKNPLYCHSCSFGLGYDSVTDDYKVVIITEIFPSIEVWVFSLKANDWRKVQDFPYSGYSTDFSVGYFADGALHFLLPLKRDYSQSGIIAVFDMVNESFCVIPLPIYRTEKYCPSLDVVDECLCMGSFSFSLEQGEMYVKKKDGNGFTWSKFYTVNKEQFDISTVNKEQFIKEFGCEFEFYVGFVEPLAYSAKKDKVLLDVNGCYIFWYNLEEKRGEIVDIIGKPLVYHSEVCWESLVSLGNDSEFDGNFAV